MITAFLRLAAMLSVLLLGVIASGCADPGARPMKPPTFVDTIGVNIHLFYSDTAYDNFAMVQQRLAELGVRHVRDQFDPDRRQFFFDRVNGLAATGIKSTLIACRTTGQSAWQADPFIDDAKNRVRTSLDAVEGINEPDRSGYSDWVGSTRDCQNRMYRLAHDGSYGAPLAQPILGPSTGSDRVTSLGYIGDRAEAGNFHPYPGGEAPSGPLRHPLVQQLADVRKFAFNGRRVPVHATETGYHDAVNCSGAGCNHPPVSQKAAAIYVPRLFFEQARAGVTRTFLYELVDEAPDTARSNAEHNFGLFENDWSYKPSASALRNLIGLLDSAAVDPPTPLGFKLINTADPDGPGPRGPVRDLLLKDAEGSWWLALWQDSRAWDENERADIDNPPARVGVTLNRRASFVTRYRPTYGSGGVGLRRGVRSFSVGVDDDVLLLKIIP